DGAGYQRIDLAERQGSRQADDSFLRRVGIRTPAKHADEWPVADVDGGDSTAGLRGVAWSAELVLADLEIQKPLRRPCVVGGVFLLVAWVAPTLGRFDPGHFLG